VKLKLIQIREASGDIVSSPDIIMGIMAEEARVDRECFWVFHLNTANRIIEKELVSMGTVSNALVHPREVFKKAIVNGATGILLTVHNHPAGQPSPSKEDIMIWEKLDEAGNILGIKTIDHLIITPSGVYYSRVEGKNFSKKEEE
jgi:DNA repair protein RadC